MADVCITLSNNASITAFLTPLEALITQTALDFGRQCSILSSLDSFLEDSGIKSAVENAFKDVMNAATTLFTSVNNLISHLNSLLEEGLNLLLNYIETAFDIISAGFTAIANVMSTIASALSTALNAVLSAACNTLSEALTGIPSNIKFQSVGLQVADYALQNIAAMTTNKLIGNILNNQNVSAVIGTLATARNTLLSIPPIPNLGVFVCVSV
jgi:phage-related protein